MTDQTTMTELDAKAIVAGGDAIETFLKRESPDVARLVFRTECEQLAELAIRAAGEVYDADQQAAGDRALAEAGIISMEALPEQGVRLKIALGMELAVKMGEAFRAVLDANAGAVNYVEQVFVPRDGGEPVTVTVCRPSGKTPHHLRREAEAQRDALAEELARIAALAQSVATTTNASDQDRTDTLEQIQRLAAQAATTAGGQQ